MKKRPLQNRILRSLFLFSLLIGIFVIFSARLFQLQVIQYDQWSQRSQRNHVRKRTLDIKRGTIFDRNGVELAISVDTYNVFLFTREVRSLPDAVNALASVLPVSRDEITEIVEGRSGYLPIYRNLEPTLAMKLQQMRIPGVNLESSYRRFYPQNNLAAHIIGFTSGDRRGIEGIEWLYEESLRGYPGLAVIEDASVTDSEGSQMRVIRPPMGGSNIYLTIDSFIQHTIETELNNIMQTLSPVDASAIAIDPHTGEILGMACVPNFNLNEYNTAQAIQRSNRPVIHTFEPGSSMKIFGIAGALTKSAIDHGTRFYCRGHTVINGRRMRCTRSHGLIDINQALAQSCNVAMVNITQLIDNAQLYRTYRNFGFGQPTGIDLPGEVSGTLRPPSRWSSFSASSLAIGQEISVSLLQIARAYSAIANGGNLVKPQIIRKITTSDHDTSHKMEPEIITRAISAPLARWLRSMLMGAVEFGTGTRAALDDYTVGGKTSTAQKPNPEGGYHDDQVVVSFAGMAPALDPRVVLVVTINAPKGDSNTLYGGRLAAPSFARIMNRILKHMNVPPDKRSFLTAQQKQLLLKHRLQTSVPQILPADAETPKVASESKLKADQNTVPDLKGKTIRSAMIYLQERKLQGVMEGNGVVVSQTPPAGHPIPEDRTLILSFSSKTPD